ncbi:MAG: hypothetical protein ABI684_14420 [Nitrospirota bacterium]
MKLWSFDVRSPGPIQATLQGENEQAWNMRGQARRSPVLVQRAVADSPRWTRAVGDQSNPPSGEKMGKQRSLDARNGDHTSRLAERE